MMIYLADVPVRTVMLYTKLVPGAKLNLLLAFGSRALEDFLKIQHQDIIKFFPSLFLDCGAFSINSGKKNPEEHRKITVENFIRFNKRSGYIFDYCASLDEDFTADGDMTNLNNLHLMEKAGLTPLPVVHDIYGEELDIFIDHGYKYICLGSALVNNKKALEYVMERTADKEIKLHFFGQINFKQLAYYSVYSCDSTGWAQKVSHGKVCWWNPGEKELNKTETFYIPNRLGKTGKNNIHEHPCREQFKSFLHSVLGIDYLDFLTSTALQQVVNLHYFVTLEQEINKIQREKGFFTAE